MFITFDSFAVGALVDNGQLRVVERLAKARARTTPPTSGDTTILFVYDCFQRITQQNRRRIYIVHGDIEKPLYLVRMQVDRQQPIHTRTEIMFAPFGR